MTPLFAFAALLLAQQPPPSLHELYRAQVAAAEGAERLGEQAEARAWLDATPPSERGFEWRAHDAAMDESLATWLVAGGPPTCLAASPDGARVVVGTATGALVLLDAGTGAELARVAAHEQALTDVKLDAKGLRIATCSFDRRVKVWDAATLALVAEFTGHDFPVGGVVLAPDLTWAASSSYRRPEGAVEGIVHAWSPRDGSLLRTLSGGRKPLVDLALGPDGASLAAASWDFCAFVWRPAGGEPTRLPFPDEGLYNAADGVAWSPDGKLVAACGRDRTARVFDATSGALVATLRGHVDAVAKLAFSPDGTQLATASADGTARLWKAEGWTQRALLRGHADDVEELAFSPDGARLYSASKDGTVRSWDARTPWHGGVRFATSAAAYVVRFNRQGTALAVASYDGRVEIRDARTWERVAAWQAHDPAKSCHALDWSPDGARVVTGSHDATVRVFEAARGRELAVLPHEQGVTWLRVSPDGALVAVASGAAVVVSDLATRERLHELRGHGKAVLSVAFSPDSRWCVSSGRDGRARTWNARTGEAALELDAGSEDVADALFTHDGSHVVVAGRNGRVRLHDARTGAMARELLAGRHEVTHVALSADGTRLALASDAIRLVDVADGGEVGVFRPHRGGPYHLDFDPSGERLASCSTDAEVAITDSVPLRRRLGAP